MNDDELLESLRRADPDPGDSIDPAGGPRAAQLMEQIMSTPDIQTTDTPPPAPRGRKRWTAIAVGGVALAAIAIGIVAVASDGSSDPVSTASYTLPASDIMQMCLAVTDYVPGPGLGGFRGTVAGIDSESVTMDVTKWYAGGSADKVVLDVGGMPIVALDGVEFVQGGDYLVAVLDGQVLICGLSGPYSPELAALYDKWFA